MRSISSRTATSSLGASWPYQTNTLQADNVPVKDLIPRRGPRAGRTRGCCRRNPSTRTVPTCGCSHVARPLVQAQQAIFFGETPANTKACAEMDKIDPGSCAQVPRRCRRGVLRHDQVLEDAAGRTAATATPTAWTTRPGNRPGRRSPASNAWPAVLTLRAALSWAARRRLSAAFWRRGWLRGTLPSPAAPRVVRAALPERRSSSLLVSAFWSVDPFTTELVHDWNLDNFQRIFTEPVYLHDRLQDDRDRGRWSRSRTRSSRFHSPTSWRASPRRGPARLLFVARAPAAVGELPRARLRLAPDPRQGRRPQLDARPARPPGGGTSRIRHWRCGSSSRTSGSPS